MVFNFFKNKKDPQTVLEGLDKAVEILNHRLENKSITMEEFSKKCEEIGKKRTKYQKMLDKKNN